MTVECENEASARSWAVVNTHPHRERVALDNLQAQEFEAYCPWIMKRVRHAGRSRDVLRPLFPGYVFVGLDRELHRWRPILSTYGVRKLVLSGEQPSRIGGDFIDCLRAREVNGAVVKPDQTLSVGQQVRITSGPFDGTIAKILELSANERLIVLMDLLNQTVKVNVHSYDVQQIGSSR